ncbi:MAG: hypothetical protein AAF532_07110 [Planctomycetota bacterium]
MYLRVAVFALRGLLAGLMTVAVAAARPDLWNPAAAFFPGALFGLGVAAAWARHSDHRGRLVACLLTVGAVSGAFASLGTAVVVNAFEGLVLLCGATTALLAVAFGTAASCSAGWRIFTAALPRIAEACGLVIAWPPRAVWSLAVTGSVATGLIAADIAAGGLYGLPTWSVCVVFPTLAAAPLGLCRVRRRDAGNAVAHPLPLYVGQST